MKEIITTNQGNNMNINKYIKTPLASETELLSYELLLNCQIADAQETLALIKKQIKKIELRKPNDISGKLWSLGSNV
jgi:hypothetical protein